MRYAEVIVGSLLVGINVFAQCPMDGIGHPIFGSLHQRPDAEIIDGELGTARMTGVAFGDLDGDGLLDAVCAGAAQGQAEILERTYLTVLMNQGEGVYASPSIYDAGREVVMPALADFDLDGDLDVAVTNARDDTISILFNDGDGALSGETVLETGAMPRSLVARDLDGDRDSDLAVLNVGANSVSILMSNGDGSFQPHVVVPAGSVTDRGDPNPTFPFPGPWMDAGDLDGDGDVDLAVPAGSQVNLLVNDGEGGFALHETAADVIGASAYDIAACDLNGDGRLDLAVIVSHTSATAVNVVFNEGELRFADPIAYSADYLDCPECDYDFTSIDAGDLDGDGAPEIVIGQAVAHQYTVGLFQNLGQGLFAGLQSLDFFQRPWVVELEDVTGDGCIDLIGLTHPQRSGLRIYVNDGEGELIRPRRVALNGRQTGQHKRMAPGDLDGDGLLDLVTVNRTTVIEIYDGLDDGTFRYHGQFAVDEPADIYELALGDLDANGLDDLVLADGGTFDGPGAIWIAMQTAPFEFDVLAPILLEDAQAHDVAVADMDGDGDLDVLARLVGVYQKGKPVDRRLLVLSNDGAGSLTGVQDLKVQSQIYWTLGGLAVGDVDDDGDIDVLAASGPINAPSTLSVLLNEGGVLTTESTIELPTHVQSLRLQDLDGDGVLDVALLFNHNGNDLVEEPFLVIARGEDGGFVVTQEIVKVDGHSNGQLVFADLDGDGDIDLASPDSAGFVLVHLNDGDGQFGPGVGYTQVEHTPALAGFDVDGDGRVDLIGANANSDGLTIIHSNLCSCSGDLNEDGELNVLDFVAFQLHFQDQDMKADCDRDGRLSNPLDFICFHQLFLAGCE